jgi:hypothetical protein
MLSIGKMPVPYFAKISDMGIRRKLPQSWLRPTCDFDGEGRGSLSEPAINLEAKRHPDIRFILRKILGIAGNEQRSLAAGRGPDNGVWQADGLALPGHRWACLAHRCDVGC